MGEGTSTNMSEMQHCCDECTTCPPIPKQDKPVAEHLEKCCVKSLNKLEEQITVQENKVQLETCHSNLALADAKKKKHRCPKKSGTRHADHKDGEPPKKPSNEQGKTSFCCSMGILQKPQKKAVQVAKCVCYSVTSFPAIDRTKQPKEEEITEATSTKDTENSGHVNDTANAKFGHVNNHSTFQGHVKVVIVLVKKASVENSCQCVYKDVKTSVDVQVSVEITVNSLSLSVAKVEEGKSPGMAIVVDSVEVSVVKGTESDCKATAADVTKIAGEHEVAVKSYKEAKVATKPLAIVVEQLGDGGFVIGRDDNFGNGA